MKYLDEQIEITISFAAQALDQAGVYNFYVYEYNYYAQTEDEQLIYVGCYYNNGRRQQKIDITNIVRSRKPIWDITDLLNPSSDDDNGGYVTKYKVKAMRGETAVTSSWLGITYIWRYPNVSVPYTNGNPVFSFNQTVSPNWLKPALQGTYTANNLVLTPHYPLKDTVKYHYAQLFVHPTTLQQFYLQINNVGSTIDFYQTVHGHDTQTTKYSNALSYFLDWQYYEPEYYDSGDLTVTLKPEQGITNHTIAVFDKCYKRYYLQWEDRYGGIQSQAFNDYSKFTEEFNVTETQNYQNRRTKSVISVQPKWKLSSGWISEDVFAFYESIYVSPNVVLYDTQEDVTYDVFVTGEWTEKKFKNEKKLLNITLDLELKTKQNIIY